MAQVQERRPASNRASGDAPRPPDDDNRITRLIAAASRRRRTLRRVGLTASALIITVSLTIFVRTLLHVDVNKFKRRLRRRAATRSLSPSPSPPLSYLALTGYDGLALKHLGTKGPLLADGACVIRELRRVVHPRVSAGDGRGRSLLALCARRPYRRQGRQSHRRGRRHLLARHGLHRRSRFYLRFRRGGGNRPLQPARQSADRDQRDSSAHRLSRLGRHACAGGTPRCSAPSGCPGRCSPLGRWRWG